MIAAVTAVCAAYTLMAFTGVAGDNATPTDSKQSEITVDAPAAGVRSETTPHPERRTAFEEKRAPDTTSPASLATAIGDSAMLSATDTLQQEIPNLALLDAQGSRQPQATIALLHQYRADGHLGDVVIVHIGYNGPFTTQDFDEMMKVLAGVRRVLVVNLPVPKNVENLVAVPNDAVLLGGAWRYPTALLIDWYSVSAGHPGYL